MSAKEMFEELGYYKKINENQIGFFKRDIFENITELILFNKTNKTTSLHVYASTSPGFNMQEFKAIQQQIKELGWDE